MGRSSFLSVLLLSLFIALCFTSGFGRKMRMLEAVDSHHASRLQLKAKESGGKWRMMMMIETMDYSDPEANTNKKGGYVPPPPPIHG